MAKTFTNGPKVVHDEALQSELLARLQDIVLYDMAYDVDINDRAEYGKVRALLEQGLDPNVDIGYGGLRIVHLVEKCQWGKDALDDLIEYGAELNVTSKFGKSLLMSYADSPNGEELAQYALALGANPRLGEEQGSTLIVSAASGGHFHLMCDLLENGVPAISDVQPKEKRTSPLTEAITQKNGPRFVVRLLEAGIDLDHQRVTGALSNTALLAAVFNHDHELSCQLIDAGASPFVTRAGGDAYHFADKQQKSPKYQQMVNVTDYRKMPVLKLAEDQLNLAGKYSFNRPKELRSKEQLFKRNNHGMAALDNPMTWHHWDQVATILQQKGEAPVSKAELMQKNRQGRSFLRRGIECMAAGALQEQLQRSGESITKEDLLVQDYQGKNLFANPMTWAQIDMLDYALSQAGEVWTKEDLLREDKAGKTVLAYAAEMGKLEWALGKLKAQGEWLRPDDIDQIDGFGELLSEMRECGTLFRAEFCEGHSTDDLRAVMARLPDGASDQVHNYHQMIHAAQRSSGTTRER